MRILTFVVSIFIAQGAGILGSFFTATGLRSWYASIAKPSWNPPGWVFGPVWITLYTLMGIASALVWNQRAKQGATLALGVYGIQLALNALWSILFFGLKSPALAFIEIVVLLVVIITNAILFWRIDPKAGILMIPYILWVAFAAFLNYTIWKLN